MKIAVIKTGGKQYKVKPGQTLKVEKLNGKEGDKVKFDTLLIASEDAKDFTLGAPSLGEKVEGTIKEQGRADKVSVVKFKNKIHYKRNVGHRQPYTKIEIANIA